MTKISPFFSVLEKLAILFALLFEDIPDFGALETDHFGALVSALKPRPCVQSINENAS